MHDMRLCVLALAVALLLLAAALWGVGELEDAAQRLRDATPALLD